MWEAPQGAKSGGPRKRTGQYAEEAEGAPHRQDGSWRRCSRAGMR
jgi:hypothetical protein